VHRGCTSEHCGFRQRRVAAQELESTTQRKTSRLLNTLEARLCMRDTVADRILLRSSVKLCQVGIEHMHKVQLENSVVSSEEARITEDSVSSARWALSKVQGVEELCCEFRKKKQNH
jgi:hypothetical protein